MEKETVIMSEERLPPDDYELDLITGGGAPGVFNSVSVYYD